MKYKGAIFDLDGVLVDTAKYHFIAWQELAQKLNILFTEQDNERLKGVSRNESLEILLSLSKHKLHVNKLQKEELMANKNHRYIQLISKMDESEILTGVKEVLEALKRKKIKISLGSASKNASIILKRTGLLIYFDAVIDGNDIANAKPDPEVFILAANKLSLPNEQCIVFEDSQAGLIAANRANMFSIGIGNKETLSMANIVIKDLCNFPVGDYF